MTELERYGRAAESVLVDRDVIGYAVALADATRNPANHGLPDLATMIEYGASPRGPIGLVQAARVLALLRGRGHVAAEDVRDLAADVLPPPDRALLRRAQRGRDADELIEQVMAVVPAPGAHHLTRPVAADTRPRAAG